MKQELEVEGEAARETEKEIRFEETGGRGGQTSRERRRREGQNKGDEDVRGRGGDKRRREEVSPPVWIPSGVTR